jgi:hypothetical protein
MDDVSGRVLSGYVNYLLAVCFCFLLFRETISSCNVLRILTAILHLDRQYLFLVDSWAAAWPGSTPTSLFSQGHPFWLQQTATQIPLHFHAGNWKPTETLFRLLVPVRGISTGCDARRMSTVGHWTINWDILRNNWHSDCSFVPMPYMFQTTCRYSIHCLNRCRKLWVTHWNQT